MKTHARKSSLALTLAAGALALAAVGNASASTSPNFDSAGVSYVHFDLVNDTVSGFGLDLEKSLNEDWFVSLDYVSGSETFRFSMAGEPATSNLDFSVLTANLGYKFYQRDEVVGYASAGLSSFRTKVGLTLAGDYTSDSDTENAVNAQIGVRQTLTEEIELDANLRHIAYSGSDEQQINLGGRYKLSEQFVIGVGYTFSSTDFSYFAVSARYRF
ncbi:MAG: porin family protein [Idiomarina sp.]|nr:porin family protein [Idiomarina sp.]